MISTTTNKGESHETERNVRKCVFFSPQVIIIAVLVLVFAVQLSGQTFAITNCVAEPLGQQTPLVNDSLTVGVLFVQFKNGSIGSTLNDSLRCGGFGIKRE